MKEKNAYAALSQIFLSVSLSLVIDKHTLSTKGNLELAPARTGCYSLLQWQTM
jgi:hypothetical protein